jgi:hypothetical protein
VVEEGRSNKTTRFGWGAQLDREISYRTAVLNSNTITDSLACNW